MKHTNRKYANFLLILGLVFTGIFTTACDDPTQGKLTSYVFTAEANPGLRKDAVGIINDAGDAVSLTVPLDTDVTVLVGTYAAEKVVDPVVTIAGLEQINGVTPNNFTNPVIYEVHVGKQSRSISVRVHKTSAWIGTASIHTADDLKAMAGYDSIAGDLLIRNTNLESLAGLEGIRSISGSVRIKNNAQLTDLGGLSGLNHIGETLDISSNEKLAHLNGLQNLDKVFEISLESNPLLADLSALAHINSLEGALHIIDSPLRDLEQLANLNYAGGVSIKANANLTDVQGLRNLSVVGQRFNPVAFGLQFKENPLLEKIEGLNNLHYARSLVVRDNPRLHRIKGFQSLDTVLNMNISFNDSLLVFEELPLLTSIQHGLYVHNNAKLDNLDFIGKLLSLDKFYVYYNPSLPNQLVLDRADALAISGTVRIDNNME